MKCLYTCCIQQEDTSAVFSSYFVNYTLLFNKNPQCFRTMLKAWHFVCLLPLEQMGFHLGSWGLFVSQNDYFYCEELCLSQHYFSAVCSQSSVCYWALRNNLICWMQVKERAVLVIQTPKLSKCHAHVYFVQLVSLKVLHVSDWLACYLAYQKWKTRTPHTLFLML